MSGPVIDARCPRCGGGFECGFQAGHCACFGIRLSERLRQQLADQYRTCVCMACLRELMEADGSRQSVIGGANASG